MAEITAEIMVWEGCKVTGPIIDQKVKSLLSMIMISTGGLRPHGQEQEMRDGSFSTGNSRESFDETAGVVERGLYVRPASVLSRQYCRPR